MAQHNPALHEYYLTQQEHQRLHGNSFNLKDKQPKPGEMIIYEGNHGFSDGIFIRVFDAEHGIGEVQTISGHIDRFDTWLYHEDNPKQQHPTGAQMSNGMKMQRKFTAVIISGVQVGDSVEAALSYGSIDGPYYSQERPTEEFDSEEEAISYAYKKDKYAAWIIVPVVRFTTEWETRTS